ncbi:MAG: hypothetical protein GC131_09410, partial [Alphaproteobacteria bacterium]|nr:hypothetical protein [Alphaproteobacteria bacterium]
MRYFAGILCIAVLAFFCAAPAYASNSCANRNYELQGDARCGDKDPRPPENASAVFPGVSDRALRAYDDCVFIDNDSDKTYFIPLGSKREWDSFRIHKPSKVYIHDLCTSDNSAITVCDKKISPPITRNAHTFTATIDDRTETYKCEAGPGCTAKWTLVSSSGACKTPVDGTCGSSNGVTASSKPTTGLCSEGTASAVSGNGPWLWSCAGKDGGSSVSCAAGKVPPVNGACGASHGKSLASAPTGSLCAAGTASGVSGSGPWNWSCAGSDGGSNASCAAAKEAGQVVKLSAGGGGLIQWGGYQNTSVAGFNWDNAMHVCAAAGYEYIVAARGRNGRGDCSSCGWTLWSNPGHPPVAQLPNYKIPAANSGKWSVRGQGSWSSASELNNVWCSSSPGQRVPPDCKGGVQTAYIQKEVTPEICTRKCVRCATTCTPPVYVNVPVTMNLPDGYWSDYSYGLPITTVHPNDNRAIHWGADDYGVAAVYYTKSSL